MGPEFVLVLLLFALLTVPLFIGAVVLINRRSGDDREAEIEELKQRVQELESEQN
ncbi:hypothetical protein ACKVMT_17490 [Halobacteriales archaeon Cl-PHB]